MMMEVTVSKRPYQPDTLMSMMLLKYSGVGRGQHNGSAGKGICTMPNHLSSFPRTHVEEGEN